MVKLSKKIIWISYLFFRNRYIYIQNYGKHLNKDFINAGRGVIIS